MYWQTSILGIGDKLAVGGAVAVCLISFAGHIQRFNVLPYAGFCSLLFLGGSIGLFEFKG